MTRLPDRNLLEGTKQPDTTTGEFRLAMGNLQQFIADLLGTDSAEKQTARNIFGVQEKYRAEASGTSDELAATFDQTITRPIHGMHVQLRAGAPNTSAAPTFRADETGAIPIVKGNGLPLLPAISPATVTGSNSSTMPNWKNGSLKTPPAAYRSMHLMEPKLAGKADKTELEEKLATKLDTAEKAPIGSVIAVAGNITPDGYLHCNGAEILTAVYPELFAVIGYTYGGDGATVFRLPDLRGRWMQGNDTAGQVLAAGLPNVYGYATSSCGVFNNADGAFCITASAGDYDGQGAWAASTRFEINASRSNPIYGASDTVRPLPSPSVTASNTEESDMNPSIIVYEYDKTGLYTGETTAEPSPREEGVWLIPANATPLEPPVTGEHECAVFRNGRWSVRYDFRGTTYWLPDGSEHTITETGMIVPENALTEPPSPSLESVRKKRLAELDAAFGTALKTAHCTSSAGFEINADEKSGHQHRRPDCLDGNRRTRDRIVPHLRQCFPHDHP